MIVFHAGTVKIEKFYIPYGGLHFGGMHSAIECALRHIHYGRLKGHDIDTIHIHRCELLSTSFYESEDMGGDSAWKKLNDELFDLDVDFDFIKYINKHEPDVVPSYCTFRTGLVKIIDHSTMHMDVAEDILNGTYSDEYRYSY